MAPIDLVSRLLSSLRKDNKKDVPFISPSLAAVLSIVYTLIYVIPFYLSRKTRPSPDLSRDAPSVIRARIRAVTLSCLITAVITVYIAIEKAQLGLHETLQILGWWPINLFDIVKSFALVFILFLGPLFETVLVDGAWRDWVNGTVFTQTLQSAIGWRNYVAGPFTEEAVFRSLIIPLHLLCLPPSVLSPTSPKSPQPHPDPATFQTPYVRLIFLTPLYFGIAHIHHFYEYRLTHPHSPLIPSLVRSLFQFTYTSVFGWYAAFLFLRTGSLWSCVIAHAWCNAMGLPRFWGRVGAGSARQEVEEIPIGPAGNGITPKDAPHAERYSSHSGGQGHQFERQISVVWSLAYYVLLTVGAVSFYMNLWPLTQSKSALVGFGTGDKPGSKNA